MREQREERGDREEETGEEMPGGEKREKDRCSPLRELAAPQSELDCTLGYMVT